MAQKMRQQAFLSLLFIFILILSIPLFVFKEFQIIRSKKHAGLPNLVDPVSYEKCKTEKHTYVILIPTSNDEHYIRHNLISIFDQSYPNYRVYYIDGGSHDQTVPEITKFLREHELNNWHIQQCYTKNEFLQSYSRIISEAKDDEIIIHLEGSDWLAHEDVLKHLEKIYSNQDVWLSYGQYLEFPSYKKGIYNPLPKKHLYKKRVHRAPWVLSPFRTFYAGLFKQFAQKDLQSTADWGGIQNDKILLTPMLEMAKNHVRYVPEVLFIHNESGVERGYLQLGTYTEAITRSLREKQRQEANAKYVPREISIVLVSEHGYAQLRQSLQSIRRHVKGIDHLVVLYAGYELSEKQQSQLIKKYPKMSLVRAAPSQSLKKLFLSLLASSECPGEYIGVLNDEDFIHDEIDLRTCSYQLYKQHADAFYFYLGKNQLHPSNLHQIQSDIILWEIGERIQSKMKPLHFTLYDKEVILKNLDQMHFDDFQSFKQSWEQSEFSIKKALIFEKAKICAQMPSR